MKQIVTLLLTIMISVSAKDITLHTLNKHTIHIQDFEGNLLFQEHSFKQKNILLFFFGVHCPYCIREFPALKELAKSHPDLQIIGVHGQFEIADDALKRFVRKQGFTFSILDAKTTKHLIAYLSKRHLWLGSVPYHIMIDRYGNLEPVEFDEIVSKL